MTKVLTLSEKELLEALKKHFKLDGVVEMDINIVFKDKKSQEITSIESIILTENELN